MLTTEIRSYTWCSLWMREAAVMEQAGDLVSSCGSTWQWALRVSSLGLSVLVCKEMGLILCLEGPRLAPTLNFQEQYVCRGFWTVPLESHVMPNCISGCSGTGTSKQASPQQSPQAEAQKGWSKNQTQPPILLTAQAWSVTTHQPGTTQWSPVFLTVVFFSCPLRRPAFSAVFRSVSWQYITEKWACDHLKCCFQMTLSLRWTRRIHI